MPTRTTSRELSLPVPHRITRRAALGMFVGGTGAFLLASCAAPTPSAPANQAPASSSGAKPAATSAAAATDMTPQRGGVFTEMFSANPKTLHPWAPSGLGFQLNRFVYQKLVEMYQPTPDYNYLSSLKVEPLLAESWDRPDDTTYVFHLRRGAKFSDGSELTADDVLYSFATAGDAGNQNTSPAYVSLLAGVTAEKIDPSTVKVKLPKPQPDFLLQLAYVNSTGLMIASKAAHDRGENLETQTAGTGPFIVSKFTPPTELSLVRHPYYWDPGKPYLDGIRVILNGDRSAIQAAFTTRQTDMAYISSKVEFDQYKRAVPDLVGTQWNTYYNYGFMYRMDRPPFNDQRVRHAFHLVIDRPALSATVALGTATIRPPLDSGSGYWGDYEMSQADLEKIPGWKPDKTGDIQDAKKLMADAGYANGLPAKPIIIYNNTLQFQGQLVETMAGQIKQALGVDLDIRPQDGAGVIAALNSGQFDINFADPGYPPLYSAMMTAAWYSKSPANKYGMNDPDLDAQIQKFATLDDPDRLKALSEISQLVISKDYMATSVDPGLWAVTQPWLHNWYENFAGIPYIRKPQELWMEVDKVPKDRQSA